MNLIDIIKIVIIFLVTTSCLHIFICRITSSKSFLIKGFTLGVFSTVILGIYLSKVWIVDVVGLYLFFTTWLLYLIVLINLLNSVTLKMLEYLYNETSGTLQAKNFNFIFNEEDGLKTRIDSMKTSGFVIYEDKGISLTTKSRLLLKIIFLIRKVFSIDQVG